MLQWMGGSRRKVTTSRKATRSRQRQYFEQKRRRQLIGDEKDLSGSEKHSKNKVLRSLDVLSLMSLSALTHQVCKPGLNLEAETALRNDPVSIYTARKTVDDDDLQPGCSRSTCDRQPGLESDSNMSPGERLSLENSANNHPLCGKDLPCKKGGGLNFVKKSAETDLSVINLLSDDGRSPEKQPTNEAHVAFSIEGLGKLDAQTPKPVRRISATDSLRPPKLNVRSAASKKRKGPRLNYNIDMWSPRKLIEDKAIASSEANLLSDFWGEVGFSHDMEENTRARISTQNEDKRVFDERSWGASMSRTNEVFHTVTDLNDFSVESKVREWNCGSKYSCLSNRRVAEKGLQDLIEWPFELKPVGSGPKRDPCFLYEESDWVIDTGLPWCELMQDTTDSPSLSREGSLSLGAANSHAKKSESDSLRTPSRKRKPISQLERDLKCDEDIRIFNEAQDSFVDFDDVHWSRTKVWPQSWCPQNLLDADLAANQRDMESQWNSFLGAQSPLANEEFLSFPYIDRTLGNYTGKMDPIYSHDLHFHVPDCSPSFRPFTKHETVGHFIPDIQWAVGGCELSESYCSVDPTDQFRAEISSNCRSEMRKSNSHFLDTQKQVEEFDSRRIPTDESDLQTTDCNGTFEKVPGKQPTFADNTSFLNDGEIADTIDSKDSCDGCDLIKDNSKNGSNTCEDGNGETHDSVDNKINRPSNALVVIPISQDDHVEADDKKDEESQVPDQTQ